MKAVNHLVMLGAIALIAASPVCGAAGGHASATISQIDDLDRAKMDKEETKRKREQAQQEDEMANQNDSAECGTVSIGNNDSSNQRGSNRVAPTTTTVIVTGNVYNTASCGH
jgi:hypothetical protein